jgi:hypothetical protein
MVKRFDLDYPAQYAAYARAGVFAARLWAARAAELHKYADAPADDHLNVAVSAGGTITLEDRDPGSTEKLDTYVSKPESA